MIIKHVDVGTEELIDQIENLKGENTIYVTERHKIGSQEYNFINITNETDQKDEEDNTVMIIIICIAVFVIIVLAAFLTFYFLRKSKKPEDNNISLIQKKEESEREKKMNKMRKFNIIIIFNFIVYLKINDSEKM